jgi:protein TonB
MFFSEPTHVPSMLRHTDQRLLLMCIVFSVALHAALLMLLPEYRAPRDVLAKPLIVEIAKLEPVIEPPQKEPEVRPVPREQPPVVRRPPLDPLPNPATEDKPLPIASAPPILSLPPEPAPSAPPAVTVAPAPPEPTRVVTPPPPPRVRTDAAYLHNPSPAYPMAARRRGDQGTVAVKVLVSADGFPANVSLEKTSGYPALDEAALNAVRTWRFVPAREGGQAVEALYIVPVVYKLN